MAATLVSYALSHKIRLGRCDGFYYIQTPKGFIFSYSDCKPIKSVKRFLELMRLYVRATNRIEWSLAVSRDVMIRAFEREATPCS